MSRLNPTPHDTSALLCCCRPKPAAKSVKFALPVEEVEAKTKAALDELLMVADVSEAVRCLEEIAGPDSSQRITELLLEALLNAIKDKHQELLLDVLAKAAKDGVLGKEQLQAGLSGMTETLEDLRWGPGAGCRAVLCSAGSHCAGHEECRGAWGSCQCRPAPAVRILCCPSCMPLLR